MQVSLPGPANFNGNPFTDISVFGTFSCPPLAQRGRGGHVYGRSLRRRMNKSCKNGNRSAVGDRRGRSDVIVLLYFK